MGRLPVGRGRIGPESRPRTSQVPGREVVNERTDGARSASDVVVLERPFHLEPGRFEPGEEPAVEEARGRGSLRDRCEPVGPGVAEMERRDVPERSERARGRLADRVLIAPHRLRVIER